MLIAKFTIGDVKPCVLVYLYNNTVFFSVEKINISYIQCHDMEFRACYDIVDIPKRILRNSTHQNTQSPDISTFRIIDCDIEKLALIQAYDFIDILFDILDKIIFREL